MPISTLYSAGHDHDVGDYQQLFQRGIEFFSTKFQRSIEELMVAPVSPDVFLLG